MSATRARAGAREQRPQFRCTECGWSTQKWVGRCGECQAWGTVAEAAAVTGRDVRRGPSAEPARPIAEVEAAPAALWPTGVDELDRVLGGGLVRGAVVLLAGEPGVGKSTLLLDVASRAAARGVGVLYVTGEESAAQVRLRAERIGALRPRLLLAAETDLGTVLGHVDAVAPDLLVVDSVQTIASDAVEGTAGGVTQVREVAASLIRGRQGPGHGHGARRPRHQGRVDRGPARPRAPGRRRLLVRGRPAHARCGMVRARQEPVRRRRTRSAASSSARTASPACPTPAGSSWSATRTRFPARP